MKTTITKSIVIAVMIVSFLAPVSIVSAASGQSCSEVTDAYGTKRRICDTSIVFGDEATSLPSELVIALGGVFSLGALMTLNGKAIRSKLD